MQTENLKSLTVNAVTKIKKVPDRHLPNQSLIQSLFYLDAIDAQINFPSKEMDSIN
jgi:hypothetical protein